MTDRPKFWNGKRVSWRGQDAIVSSSQLSATGLGWVYVIELPTANRMMKFGIREDELRNV